LNLEAIDTKSVTADILTFESFFLITFSPAAQGVDPRAGSKEEKIEAVSGLLHSP